MQVGVQNPQKQQRRHGDVEHQGRCGVDKVVVDPIDAREQDAQKQHGKYRRGDCQGLQEYSQHAGENLG